MEITLKQKMIVTIIMALVFTGSILVKYHFQEQKDLSVEAAGTPGSERESIDVPGAGVPVEEEFPIIVDVEGAVQNPGIVQLAEGSRVYQAIEKAGGVLANADTKYINQAEEVIDGVIIYIPYLEGSGGMAHSGEGGNTSAEAVGGSTPQQSLGGNEAMGTPGPVNINTANLETLMTLPGIGESYASAIITYREQNGYFQSVDELKNIEGIGEKKFEKLKDQVSVY